MTTREWRALGRLATLEFRHGLRWRGLLSIFSSPQSPRLAGCWLWAIAIPVLLWFIVSVGIARSLLVEWRHVDPTPLSALAWLLWTLGGLIPVAGSLLSGSATWDHPRMHTHGSGGRPITGALPLRWRGVVTARVIGRTAAFALHLVNGLIFLVLAHLLMAGGNFVVSAPTLADPWLYIALFVHLGFMTAGIRLAEATRWQSLQVGGLRFAGFFVMALSGGGVALRYVPFTNPNWWWAHALGFALIGVATLALLQAVPAVRRLEDRLTGSASRRATADGGAASTPYVYGSFAGFFTISTRGLGGMRGRTGAWLSGLVGYALRMVAICVLAGLVLQLIILAYGFASGAPADEFLLDFFGGIPAAAFAVALAGAGVVLWPEVSTHSWWVSGSRTPDEHRRHSGDLLPIPARALWTQRAITLPITWLVLTAGGFATIEISQLLRALIDPQVPLAQMQRVPFLMPLAMAALTVSYSLIVFILIPMLRRAVRALPLGVPLQSLGCLGWLTFMAGMMLPIMIMVAADVPGRLDLEVARVFGLALILWCALGLIASGALYEPRRWPYNERGTPAVTARINALLVYVFALIGATLAGAAIWAIVPLMLA